MIVFIHSSIKTRIETLFQKGGLNVYQRVFIHSSIKTRIETYTHACTHAHARMVFIHSSIKTRIETFVSIIATVAMIMFLYIVPLKQGLKRSAIKASQLMEGGFYT